MITIIKNAILLSTLSIKNSINFIFFQRLFIISKTTKVIDTNKESINEPIIATIADSRPNLYSDNPSYIKINIIDMYTTVKTKLINMNDLKFDFIILPSFYFKY